MIPVVVILVLLATAVLGMYSIRGARRYAEALLWINNVLYFQQMSYYLLLVDTDVRDRVLNARIKHLLGVQPHVQDFFTPDEVRELNLDNIDIFNEKARHLNEVILNLAKLSETPIKDVALVDYLIDSDFMLRKK